MPQLPPVEKTTRALNLPELSLFTVHEKRKPPDAADARP
jgi:hypothetical protein